MRTDLEARVCPGADRVNRSGSRCGTPDLKKAPRSDARNAFLWSLYARLLNVDHADLVDQAV
jgi:hypothetical protein